MVKVKIIEEKKDKLTLHIQESDATYMNALRRFMMEEVPTLAIEDVEFQKNNGILYDEMVAHRLGLLVLKTDTESYNLQTECKCKGVGCAQCTLKLTLKAKGPGYIYASDIRSKDPKCKPVHGNTPVTKLIEGQEIEAEMTAKMGIGRMHAKWSPCLAYYKYAPHVVIKKQPQNAELIKDRCPSKVFEVKGGQLKVVDENACIWCGECVELTHEDVHINKENDFLFYIEAWGQLDHKEIMSGAIDRCNLMIKDLREQFKEKTK
ncbi:MAG: DNA-directed RNA polymerase subunit D [Nanoarchaeota archaeon]